MKFMMRRPIWLFLSFLDKKSSLVSLRPKWGKVTTFFFLWILSWHFLFEDRARILSYVWLYWFNWRQKLFFTQAANFLPDGHPYLLVFYPLFTWKVHLVLVQILHTTMGDVHMKLYPEECPKTVENFTTHCRNGYYDNLIFHRVIKGFMIQTGDPLGDGTGGQSIWGREFEDEFHKR